MISSIFYFLAIVNYNLNNNILLSKLAFLMQLNWLKICIWLVVARSIKNPSQEDNMGLTYGSRCEHGVHKRRAPDGSTSFNNQKPIFERSGWDVRKWCICYCGPQVHCGLSHLQYASLKMSNLMEDISASTSSSVATKMPLSLPTYYCHPLKLKPPLLKGLHWFWSSQFVLVLVILGSQYLFKDSSFHKVSISWLM